MEFASLQRMFKSRRSSRRKPRQRPALRVTAKRVVTTDVPNHDAVLDAKTAHLHYVRDSTSGIHRHRAGKGFRYTDSVGHTLTDAATLARIRSLVIPPAWHDVWICANPAGHLQATGRDARGRKQYRYHPRWREVRDETKYSRLAAFGTALARIRRHIRRDLRQPGLPRTKVLATIVRLLETTHIRIGNEEYARSNGSFGLTTLKDKHAEIEGSTIRFHFRGKSGKTHTVSLRNKRLARVIRQCRDLPGQELFQYVDEAGDAQTIGSVDVNDYLRSITQQDFTAKDFRTWSGSLLAADALLSAGAAPSQRGIRKRIVAAVQVVAGRLGNTVSVCRKCYIHPAVLESYREGTLVHELQRTSRASSVSGLRSAEMALVAMLKARARKARRPDRLERALRDSVRTLSGSHRRKSRKAG